MNNFPKVTLEQWRMFQAVVEHGGYAQAAEALNKSQSTINYGVKKLQVLLGTEVLQVKGRKAKLTAEGEVLLRRAKLLLDDASSIEKLAETLGKGEEPVVRLAVEVIFPNEILLPCLNEFSLLCPNTRVELLETVLSGTEEILLAGGADIVIAARVPMGFLGEPIFNMEFIAVTHPEHPLQHLGRKVTVQDLRLHRQLVVRDSGVQRKWDAGWLGTEQRWTVSNMTTSINAVCEGLGFAWFPKPIIEKQLQGGVLKPLPLEEGGTRSVELYLVYADKDTAGVAAKTLAELILGATDRLL
ncbi:LysR family transcriptional regulator [Alkalimarinus coralli]|uniref:LysR family transcriptional regulator n=1 Tax=Alkalimarinus coralli TaxID=2935863 RepID=UPI00202B9AC2|nr:LysR family transcriptional regulator [Alkalimarinus coralli]